MRSSLFTMMCLSAVGLMAQTQLTVSELTYTTKAGSVVSIHDPSVVLKDGMFTIWGSHLGAATSNDLVNWKPVWTNDQTFKKLVQQGASSGSACSYADAFNVQQVSRIRNREGQEVNFPNFDAEAYCSRYASDRNTWIAGNMWAPDIIYNKEMQKWCMYMSLNGDHWSSIIVLLTSNTSTGPWTYQGPVVMGGFHGQTYGGVKPVQVTETDYEIATGEKVFAQRYTQSDNGKYWPNCIDPCVFYDEEGELWMTYGSWSGGIFMLKLDKTNGLRDYTYIYNSDYATKGASGVSDPYFGRKIAGGYYVSGEGSYVQHIGQYYYLFMSYGFFAPGGKEPDGTLRGGGYDMRIFRSQKPEGPYVDANGTSALFTSYQMNYGPNPQNVRGMRLMSAYNEWGELQEVGERSQGHNSACVDESGRAFVVYHTKFNDGSVGHQVRVHQLFVNKKGWLVAAPFCYQGEEQALLTDVSKADLCGEYRLLLHPTKQNFDQMEEEKPVLVTLTEDGKVTGDIRGSWNVDEAVGTMYIRVGSTTYNGVFCQGSVNGATKSNYKTSNLVTIGFTAICDIKGVANTGTPVWGYKLAPKSALAFNYQANKSTFLTEVRNKKTVDKDLNLIFPTTHNVCLTWTSSLPEVISTEGVYNPKGLTEVTPVTLVGRLECGNYYWEREYTVNAKPIEGTGVEDILAERQTYEYPIFDLSGRKVNGTNRSGIYIVNGKKVVR